MTEQQAKEIIQLLRQINEKLPELQKPKYETKMEIQNGVLNRDFYKKTLGDEKTKETET